MHRWRYSVSTSTGRVLRSVLDMAKPAVYLTLVFCVTALGAIAAPGIAATKHAYLSGANDADIPYTLDARTVAYAVNDGRLADRPDRIYQDTAGPIAFDVQGRLYASQFECSIAVFAKNSTRLVSKLQIFDYDTCGYDYYRYWNITALTVDRAGYIYVSLELFAGSALHKTSGYDCGLSYFACTLVYAPGSSGSTPPIQVIDPFASNDGLATDSAGNLYVHEIENEIDVIAHPTTHPKHVRKIVPRGLYDARNPVISDGLLYVQVRKCANGGAGPCEPGVAVFPENAHGVVKPLRLIILPLHANWWNIAISDAGLYAGAGGPTVQAFHKTANGEVMPLFTSLLYPVPTFPQYLEFGP